MHTKLGNDQTFLNFTLDVIRSTVKIKVSSDFITTEIRRLKPADLSGYKDPQIQSTIDGVSRLYISDASANSVSGRMRFFVILNHISHFKGVVSRAQNRT